ncbi:hypothetical protein [Microbacterium sp. CH12i]|uniref:hypothetical protein n=1 Tax=Microbacterium sp. CH12i TaxID=1479651 RepID=UPI001F20C78E|nr:hypothetical protein [Microbacterium sp. CH12i]
MSSRPSYYDTDEWIEFDETLHATAERHGVAIIDANAAQGVWMSDIEPASAYVVRADSFDDIKAWAGELAGRYNQDSIMAGFYNAAGPDTVYSFDAGDRDTDSIVTAMRTAGVAGGRTYNGRLEIAETADSPLTPDTKRALAIILGNPTTARAHVEFVEKTDAYLEHTPIKEIQSLRQNYAADHGFPVRERMPNLTAADDIAAARAYEAAPHEPTHPRVVRSYRYFRQHIAAQWDMLTAAGYRFEPWHGDQEQPYSNSAAMLADLRNNKHLFYFRTEVSQDTEGALPTDHPMAREVTVTMHDGTTQPMIANDVFRAVHDAIAHSEGHQFGPFGEKRAWWAHRSSLPRDARLALWNETRAQNCWTNAGPHMTTLDDDGNTRLRQSTEAGWLPISQRPYAEQKCVNVSPALL